MVETKKKVPFELDWSKNWFDTLEISEYLDIARSTVYGYISSGKLRKLDHVKPYRIPKDALLEFMGMTLDEVVNG